MANTTNFNWATPDDTDLVKDGAAAIRTLGSSIDTSFIDLKGGTTGQVLSKATNTDLDYTWITPNVGDITEVQAGTGISVASGTGPIPVVTNTVATAFDAAGDLVYGTGADTFTKLSLGTAGQVLRVNSGATAPEWAAAAAGGKVLQVVSATKGSFQGIKTASATDVSSMSVSITPSSATSKVLVFGMLNGVQSQSNSVKEEIALSLVDGSNVELYSISNMHTCLDGSVEMSTIPFNYLHSPATTSAITYKLRVMNNTATTGIYVNNYNTATAITSSIIAMEIGA